MHAERTNCIFDGIPKQPQLLINTEYFPSHYFNLYHRVPL